MNRMLVFLAICTLLAGCSSRPAEITPEQIRIVNAQMDALHEQIAAASSGGAWLVLVCSLTIFAPIVLALVILIQADRIAIHHDEIFRQLHRHGLTSEIIDTGRLLEKPAASQLPGVTHLKLIGSNREHRSQECSDGEGDESG